MTNGQRGGSASKYPDEYYYDKLGPRVRKALQDSVTTWSSKWAYKMVNEKGAEWVIMELRKADYDFMKKGHKFKAFEKNHPSSCVACKVKPLRANW